MPASPSRTVTKRRGLTTPMPTHSKPATSMRDPASMQPSSPPPESDALSDVLARQLRLLILRGELSPGSRVNLDEIKGRFGVSLSPLREALSRLMAEGFVNFEAKRGFRVTEMSLGNLEEIYLLRKKLEPFALELSVRHGDEAWEERVAAALHTLGKREQALERNPDGYNDWDTAHRKFRLALISGCGMPMLLHFCSTLMDLYDRYRLHLHGQDLLPVIGHGEYRQVFEACAARDADMAVRLASEQLEQLHASLLSLLPGGSSGDPAPGPDRPARKASGRRSPAS